MTTTSMPISNPDNGQHGVEDLVDQRQELIDVVPAGFDMASALPCWPTTGLATTIAAMSYLAVSAA